MEQQSFLPLGQQFEWDFLFSRVPLTVYFGRGCGVEQHRDHGAKQLHEIHLLHVHNDVPGD